MMNLLQNMQIGAAAGPGRRRADPFRPGEARRPSTPTCKTAKKNLEKLTDPRRVAQGALVTSIRTLQEGHATMRKRLEKHIERMVKAGHPPTDSTLADHAQELPSSSKRSRQAHRPGES